MSAARPTPEFQEYQFSFAGHIRDPESNKRPQGVPARRIGWVSHDGEVLGDDLVCPRSGREYRAVNKAQIEEITP
jgi:UDP-2-acetamido-3-amino-2,3-dideoxy-glucuronate N-acetyltransferase